MALKVGNFEAKGDCVNALLRHKNEQLLSKKDVP